MTFVDGRTTIYKNTSIFKIIRLNFFIKDEFYYFCKEFKDI